MRKNCESHPQSEHARGKRFRKKAALSAAVLVFALLLGACANKTPKVKNTSSASSAKGASSMTSTQSSDAAAQSSAQSTSKPPAGGGNISKPSSTANPGGVSVPTPQTTVTVDISEFAEYGDDQTVLSQAISTVSGRSTASIVKGEAINYKLVLAKNKVYKLSATLTLQSVGNIEIDGNGSTLVWNSEICAFYMKDCQNVKFSNFSIDYDPLVYTQGVVEKIEGNSITLKVDDGYPSDPKFLNNKNGNDGLLWSNIHRRSDGGVLPGAPHSYAYQTNVQSLGGGRIKLTKNFVSAPNGRDLVVGDVISLFHRGPSAITTTGCAKLSFTSVNVYGSPGFGFSESGGDGGNTYKSVKIIPGPKPAGASENRVRSVNADGMHWGNVKNGPVLDGCTITHGGDDGINIQGFFFHVLAVNGNRLTVSPKWDTPLSVGETVEGYKDDGYVAVGTAKITAFAARRDPSKEAEIRKLYQYYDQTIGDATLLYDITLDKPLNVAKGDHITSLDRVGSGAVIKNCTFGYNRARGIVVKGRNITIENNTIIGNHLPAIVAQADILWCESGFPVNVTIRNNTITNSANCSDVLTQDNQDMIGSIVVNVAPPTNITGFYNCYQNKNILIEGNKINTTQVYGIFAINCDGITIRNNTITNLFVNGLGKVGNLYGITPKSGIFVGKSNNVTVTGNTVSGAPAAITQAVEIHSTCGGQITESGNTLN